MLFKKKYKCVFNDICYTIDSECFIPNEDVPSHDPIFAKFCWRRNKETITWHTMKCVELLIYGNVYNLLNTLVNFKSPIFLRKID